MHEHTIPPGQHMARTRWGTHESGAVFDRKKIPFLTEQAQQFIAQQALCVLAGPGDQHDLCGLLALGEPGFVRTPDRFTCLFPLPNALNPSCLLHGLHQHHIRGQKAQLALCFMCHPTRERLCVQGTVELLATDAPELAQLATRSSGVWVRLHVQQAFFHCAKYIKTRVAGLTKPVDNAGQGQRTWHPRQLIGRRQTFLSAPMQSFIEEQLLCFLCTIGADGQSAINHRGGAPGFLAVLPPDENSPGGTILLPDYAGNGAFEAIGNILETEKATLVVPDYAAQLAMSIAGSARIIDRDECSETLLRRCRGAERVMALSVQHVEVQHGDWSAALAYERIRAAALSLAEDTVSTCTL